MATVKTSSYSGRYLQLDVWEASYSVANNTSDVSWKVSSVGGTDNYYTMYSCSASVHGQTVWNVGTVGWSTKKFPAAKGETSGTIYGIGHDGSTGAASIGFSLTGAVFTNSPKTYSGGLNLTTIPRYASITGFNVNAASETEIDFSWTSSDTVDYVWYSLDNGNTWLGNDCPDGTSGSFRWGGLSANTPYNAKVCIRRRDSQLQTFYDGYKTCQTKPWPSTSAWPSGFTMNSATKTLNFTFNNPLGRTITFSATVGSYSVSNTTTGTSGSLTFNCDEAYKQIPESTSAAITFAASATGYSGSRTDQKVSADSGYAKPGINVSYFEKTIVHNKSCLSGLTKMVQGYSYLEVRYTDDKIITLNKSAKSLKSVTFTFNNVTQTLNKTSTAFNNSSTFNIGTTTNGTVTVTDSRGYSNSAPVSIPFLAYSKPTGTITAVRSDGYGTSVSIKGSATYSSLEGKNTVTMEWKAGSSGTATTFTGSATTTLDSNSTQTYYIYVEDSIGNNNNWGQSVSLGQGQPIMFVDTKNVAVGVNCFPSGKGLYVNGTKVPKITYGTADPSGGENGDIYLKYN